MTTSDRPPIVGQTTLSLGDSFAFLAAQLPRVLVGMFVLSTMLFVILWFVLLTDAERAHFDADTAAGIRRFLTDAGWMPLALTALWPVLLVVLSWVQFHRIPALNRQLRYEIDAEGIVTRDAAGTELKVPWTMVQQTRTTRHLLLLKLNTRAWRYLPWRAFAPEDRDRLLALASQSVAAGAVRPGA